MKTETLKIAQLFGDCRQRLYKENLQQLECSFTFCMTKMPTKDKLFETLPKISERDSWRLMMLNENGDDIFDLRKGCDIGEDYNIDTLQPYINESVRLVYTIHKAKKNKVLSVYDQSLLLAFLKELAVMQFMNLFYDNLGNGLVLEIWGAVCDRFSSNSIAAVGKGDAIPQLHGNTDNKERRGECIQYCQWNNNLAGLLPNDVFIVNGDKNGCFASLFEQVCILLSVCYIADFSSVDQSGIKIRMSGYRTIVAEKQSILMKNFSFDKASVEQWYKIYNWCYTGGYTAERLTIARNIISLNCPQPDILSLNASTLAAIESNFKIFEKDNVRQYIKVRNDVSKTLLELQEKVNTIVEGFTGDFRKSVITLGTFFLTIVVVRVIAKGDMYGAFTTNIFLLSLVFIVLSAINLIYSRKALDRKEKLFTKHYDQLKKRYKTLFSEEEIKELFEDSDPDKVDSHASYILWIKLRYTRLWIIALVVFLILVFAMWSYNLFESTNLYRIIKVIYSCCTRNI